MDAVPPQSSPSPAPTPPRPPLLPSLVLPALIAFILFFAQLVAFFLHPVLPSSLHPWLPLLHASLFSLLLFPLIAFFFRHHVPQNDQLSRLVASHQSEEVRRLAMVAKRTDNAVVITDATGHIQWANEGFTRITGYSLDEVLGKRPGSFLQGPQTDPTTVERMRAAIREAKPFQETIRNYRKNGQPYWIHIDCQPLHDELGNHNGFMAVQSNVSAHMEMETQLRQQRERLNIATRALGAGVWDWDMQSNKLIWDELQFRIFDIDPATATFDFNMWKSAILPEDQQTAIDALDASLRDDRGYHAVFRIRTRNGSLRWIQGDGKVLRDSSGKPTRVVGVNLDITDRILAQQRERDLAERLQRIATEVPGFVYQFKLTANGTASFPYASDGIRSVFGVSPDLVSTDATPVFNTLHPDDLHPLLESIQHSALTLSPWSAEARLPLSDGSTRWIAATSTPHRQPDGSTLWYGYCSDITDRKQIERRAVESAKRLEEAQSIARVGSWSYDFATGTVSWSRQVFHFYGLDESKGTPDRNIVHSLYTPESVAELDACTQRAVANSQPFELVVIPKNPANGVRYLRIKGEPIFAEGTRTIIRLDGTVADVTAEIEREEALRKAKLEADAANRAKSEFLANMSHEIRTPMTAILGYADLLDPHSHSPASLEDRLHSIATIRRNGEHLLQIINDVLDLSKIESGMMAVEHLPLSPASVVEDVLHLLRKKASEKNLDLAAEFLTDIPASITSDPLRLKQILVNLVGNAIKFTHEGSIRLRVSFHPHPLQPTLRFDVTDTGIGLHPEKIQHLFTAFQQIDNSMARRFGGTGLGLRISQALAKLLDGDITVESTPNGGSTFSLTIAAGAFEHPHHVDPAPAAPADSLNLQLDDRPLQGLRILLAEDGLDNQRLLQFHLHNAGALVTVVDNGQKAVDAVFANSPSTPQHANGTPQAPTPFDLILMDMQMPELDGYAATRLLRHAGCTLPILALTAHAMTDDREKCLAAGCSAYATKPIDRQSLLEACRNLIQGLPQ